MGKLVYRSVDVTHLRRITDSAGVSARISMGSESREKQRKTLEKLEYKLEDVKVFQLAQNVFDALPLVCEISARDHRCSAVVMEIRHKDFEMPDELPRGFKDDASKIEWVVGVPRLVFNVLQRQGLAPYLRYIPLDSDRSDHDYPYWVLEIRW